MVKELGTQVSKQDTVEVDMYQFIKKNMVIIYSINQEGLFLRFDDKGRKVVTDYFTDVTERIYPVGRLDYDTSGLLLFNE